MKKNLPIILAATSVFSMFVFPSHAAETRCGWLRNPTPANWWLEDKDGRWIISAQGGYQAEGMENIPDLAQQEYVKTNVNYGYACACLDVTTNRAQMRISRIHSTEQLPLKVCRADSALPGE